MTQSTYLFVVRFIVVTFSYIKQDCYDQNCGPFLVPVL